MGLWQITAHNEKGKWHAEMIYLDKYENIISNFLGVIDVVNIQPVL